MGLSRASKIKYHNHEWDPYIANVVEVSRVILACRALVLYMETEDLWTILVC